MEQRFKDLTLITPITFKEIASIGEIAGQLGVEGVENLEKFTKTIADISVTTNLTAEAAATDFARIAIVMQEPLENIDRMGSTVVDLGNNFATTEAEIVTFSQRISGAAKIAGFTVDEVFAISAALSAVGIQAEAGGSAMQKALLLMNQAVTVGGEKLDVFAKTSGLTSEEFVQLWEKDASRAFEQFVLGLGEQGDAAFQTLKSVELGGIRTARAFLSLAGAGDLITQTLDTASGAWEENTALTEEAEKRYKTFDSQMGILKNTIKILIEPLGQQLIPILLDLSKIFVNDIMPAIKPLIPIIGDFLVKVIKDLVDIIVPLLPDILELTVMFIDLAGVVMSILVPALKAILPIIKTVLKIFTDFLAIIKKVFGFLGSGTEGGGLIKMFQDIGGVAERVFGGTTRKVGDAIIRPNGQIIETHPQDTLVATRGGLGLGTTIIVQGSLISENELVRLIDDKLSDKLGAKITI